MKLNRSAIPKNPFAFNHVGNRNAHHQAGLAVSTYLGNQLKGLPALHFQVILNSPESCHGRSGRLVPKRRLSLEGGRLIPFLPASFEMATQQLSPNQKQQCISAFEADIANLLAGSLAEAKYVALRNDEVFNANLVYLGALKFYGGGEELKIIDEFMASLYPVDNDGRNKKLAELFLSAYSFVNDSRHWRAITALANTFHFTPKTIFTCEEIMAVIDEANSHAESGRRINSSVLSSQFTS